MTNMTEQPSGLHWITRVVVLAVAALAWPIVFELERHSWDSLGIKLIYRAVVSGLIVFSVELVVERLIAVRFRLASTAIVILLTVIGVIVVPSSFHYHSLPVCVAAAFGLGCCIPVTLWFGVYKIGGLPMGTWSVVPPRVDAEPANSEIAQRRPFQFSLLGMLIVVTYLAFVLGLAINPPLGHALVMSVGVASFVSVGAMLGRVAFQGWRLRLPLGAVLAAAMFIVSSQIPVPIILVGSLMSGGVLYVRSRLNRLRPAADSPTPQ